MGDAISERPRRACTFYYATPSRSTRLVAGCSGAFALGRDINGAFTFRQPRKILMHVRLLRMNAEAVDLSAHRAAMNLRDSLAKGEKGDIHPTVSNIIAILRHDTALRGILTFNEFTYEQLVTRAPPVPDEDAAPLPGPYPRLWEPADVSLIHAYIQRNYIARATAQAVDSAMTAVVRMQSYHPRAAWARPSSCTCGPSRAGSACRGRSTLPRSRCAVAPPGRGPTGHSAQAAPPHGPSITHTPSPWPLPHPPPTGHPQLRALPAVLRRARRSRGHARQGAVQAIYSALYKPYLNPI